MRRIPLHPYLVDNVLNRVQFWSDYVYLSVLRLGSGIREFLKAFKVLLKKNLTFLPLRIEYPMMSSFSGSGSS